MPLLQSACKFNDALSEESILLPQRCRGLHDGRVVSGSTSSFTFPTYPSTSGIDAEIVSAERVTVITVGTSQQSGSVAVTSEDILLRGNGFQVFGSDTGWTTTKMIHDQASGNGSVGVFIGQPMGTHHSSVQVEAGVTIPAIASPEPAVIGLVNFLPEGVR